MYICYATPDYIYQLCTSIYSISNTKAHEALLRRERGAKWNGQFVLSDNERIIYLSMESKYYPPFTVDYMMKCSHHYIDEFTKTMNIRRLCVL